MAIFVNNRRVSLDELRMHAATAINVEVWNCPGLTALPDLPAAIRVQIENCPGLTTLPAFPAATRVEVWNCPGLATLNAGLDSRGYQFLAARVRGEYRIIAGCRNLSVAEARNHWGPDGPSDRPDCRALVEKLAAEIASLE